MLTPEYIEGLRGKIKKYSNQHRSENFIRRKLIDSVLANLGWDDDDVVIVDEEYKIKGTGRVDYALLGDKKKPAVFVEAKKLRHLAEGDKQLQDYVQAYIREKGTDGYAFSVLTDGDEWLFYCASDANEPAKEAEDEPSPIPPKLVIKLSGDSPEQCCEQLKRHLSRGSVRDGSAQKALEARELDWEYVKRKDKESKKGDTIFKVRYKNFELQRGPKKGTVAFLELLDMLIEDYGECAFLRACERIEWYSKHPKEIEDRINWKGVTKDASIWIYFSNSDKVDRLNGLADVLELGDRLTSRFFKQTKKAQRDKSPTKDAQITIKYEGKEYPGGAEGLAQVLGQLIAALGANGKEKVMNACKSANLYYYQYPWIVPDQKAAPPKYKPVKIEGADCWVITELNVLAMCSYLNRLADELGASSQLEAKVSIADPAEPLVVGKEGKLKLRYREQTILETNKYKTVLSLLKLIYDEFGDDKFVTTYGEMGWGVLTWDEAKVRNKDYPDAPGWRSVTTERNDRYVYTGWLKARVPRYLDKLDKAFDLKGEIGLG